MQTVFITTMKLIRMKTTESLNQFMQDFATGLYFSRVYFALPVSLIEKPIYEKG